MDRIRRVVISHSAQETFSFGYTLGSSLKHALEKGDPIPSVICFFGDLGTGKTTCAKGIIQAVTGTAASEITSPTFTYMQLYQGQKISVCHFDLYRLDQAELFFALGFEEYLRSYLCCIEWSERIAAYLPSERITLTLRHDGEDRRHITYSTFQHECS